MIPNTGANLIHDCGRAEARSSQMFRGQLSDDGPRCFGEAGEAFLLTNGLPL